MVAETEWDSAGLIDDASGGTYSWWGQSIPDSRRAPIAFLTIELTMFREGFISVLPVFPSTRVAQVLPAVTAKLLLDNCRRKSQELLSPENFPLARIHDSRELQVSGLLIQFGARPTQPYSVSTALARVPHMPTAADVRQREGLVQS